MRRLTLLVFVILSACQTEENLVCTEKNTIPVTLRARQFFSFKTGSWWIYEEENSGKTDSVWVSSFGEYGENFPKGKKECQCGFGKCEQEIFMSFENKKYNGLNDTIKEYYRMHLSANSVDYESAYLAFSNSSFYYYQEFEFNNGKPVSDYYWNVQELAQLEVKGTMYKDIIYFIEAEGNRNFRRERWYAKNTYLIKYKDTDSTTWNLIDYHVIQ